MRYHRKTAPGVRDGRVCRKNRWRREPDYTRGHQIRVERLRPRPGFRHFVSPADVTAFLGLLPDWHELSVGLQRVVLSNDTSCLGWHTPGTVALCAWEDCRARVFFPAFHAEHADIFRMLGVPCRRVVMAETPPPRGSSAALFPDAGPPASDCLVCGKPVEGGRSWYRLRGEREALCEDCGYSRLDLPLASLEGEEEGAPGYLAEFNEATVQDFQLLHVLLHELGHHHDRMTSPGQRETTRGEPYAEGYARRYEKKIWSAYHRVFRSC
jgi:hypothetical protein